MFKNLKSFLVLLLVVVLALGFAGCDGKKNEDVSATGNATVKVLIPEDFKIAGEVSSLGITDDIVLSKLTVVLKKDLNTKSKTINITSRMPAVNFENVEEGSWDILVQVEDSLGEVVLKGEGNIQVLPGQDNLTTINVELVPATLNVSITPPAGYDITSAVITLGSMTENATLDAGQISASFYDIIPDVYLLTIELFNSTGNKVARGQQEVRLYPNTVMDIDITENDIDLVSETIYINLVWQTSPETPTNLAYSYESDELTWNAVSGQGITYTLYSSETENGFKEIVATGLTTTVFRYPEKGKYYFVRAVNADGLHSEFSSPVYVEPEITVMGFAGYGTNVYDGYDWKYYFVDWYNNATEYIIKHILGNPVEHVGEGEYTKFFDIAGTEQDVGTIIVSGGFDSWLGSTENLIDGVGGTRTHYFAAFCNNAHKYIVAEKLDLNNITGTMHYYFENKDPDYSDVDGFSYLNSGRVLGNPDPETYDVTQIYATGYNWNPESQTYERVTTGGTQADLIIVCTGMAFATYASWAEEGETHQDLLDELRGCLEGTNEWDPGVYSAIKEVTYEFTYDDGVHQVNKIISTYYNQ